MKKFYDGDIGTLQQELPNMIDVSLAEERIKQIDGVMNLEKHFKAAEVMIKLKQVLDLEDGVEFSKLARIISAVSQPANLSCSSWMTHYSSFYLMINIKNEISIV